MFFKTELGGIYAVSQKMRFARPLIACRVAAGFPSPAEDYIEGRIDLNKDLIKHPLATFYIRVLGDSMEPLICSGELLIVDRMPETNDRDIVIARIGNDLCVKRLRILDDGALFLYSENPNYKPIPINIEDDFEVWGKVVHSIKTFSR
jgi:DNA polymerase V